MMDKQNEPRTYHWTYQCHRCFIKSGYGFTGTSIVAYDNAPLCCGGETMYPVRGSEVINETNRP